MITEDIKQRLVNNAVRAILARRELLYLDFRGVRRGEIQAPEETLVTFCLVASTFCHNIRIWTKESGPIQREYFACWRGADVFEQTNFDETFLINKSFEEGGFTKHQVSGDFRLGRLEYRDDTHEFFRPGSGGWKCDFVDLDYGHLIEAKYNYFNGSPSGLHDAEYLLDYNDSDICIYKTTRIGRKRIVLPNSPKLAEFKNVMKPREHLLNVPGISFEFMQLIQSGELIPRIEKELEAYGFIWPE